MATTTTTSCEKVLPFGERVALEPKWLGLRLFYGKTSRFSEYLVARASDAVSVELDKAVDNVAQQSLHRSKGVFAAQLEVGACTDFAEWLWMTHRASRAHLRIITISPETITSEIKRNLDIK